MAKFVSLLFMGIILIYGGTEISDGFQVCNKALLDGTTKLAADRFSASSFFYSSDKRFKPEHSVLSDTSTWCSADNSLTNKNQWLQFDLGETKVITSIATKGHWDKRWLKSYYIMYSFTGVTWSTFQDGGQNKLFTGNTEATNVVTNSFANFPLVARYIRINPQDWNINTNGGNDVHLCTRAELYGCTAIVYPTFCGGFSLGMESKTIPDQSITASSFSPPFSLTDPVDWFAPYKGRLRGPSPAWCAHKDQTNTNQWLQIDLGRKVKITGVASQGQYVRGVSSYYVKYSLDNSTWSTYKESSSNKLLTGNTDSSTVVYNSLTSLQTRYIRFNPQSWRTGGTLKICMRTEVYGCDIPATYSSCSGALVYGLDNSKFTASSIETTDDNRLDPFHAKMSESHAWYAKRSQNNQQQWLMIDLGEMKVITEVATKGHYTKQVTSFFIEYSGDSTTWSTYQENKKDRIFLRVTTNTKELVRWTLKSPFLGRYVKFRPQTWWHLSDYSDLCMKVELYGCKGVISPELPSNKVLQRGSNVDITCTVLSVNQPTIIWKRGSTTLTNTSSYSIGSTPHDSSSFKTTSALKISFVASALKNELACTSSGATLTCSAQYTCQATVPGVTSPFTSATNVKTTLGIDPVLPNNKDLPRESSVDIVCNVYTLDQPTIIWKRSSNTLTNSSPYSITTFSHDSSSAKTTSTLKISFVASALKNELTCTSSGSTRTCSAQYTCQVTVPGVTQSLTSATNVKTTLVYPQTPSSPTTGNLQSRSVQVSWSSAVLGDSTLVSYKLQYRKTSDSTWTENGASPSTTTSLTGLKPFTEYKLIMELKTDFSSPLYSAVVTVKTPADIPSAAPSGLSVTVISGYELSLSWTVPPRDSWNGELTHYQICRNISTDNVCSVNDMFLVSSQTTHQLTGLNPHTLYRIRVRAKNSAGSGPWSQIVEQETPEAPPSEPTDLKGSKISETSATITWADPVKKNGQLVNFKISFSGIKTYNDTFTHIGPPENVSSTVHARILVGLYPGTKYTVTVVAINGGGQGNESTVIFITLAKGAPSPTPPILVRNTGNLTSVDVRFFPASNIYGEISLYQVIVYQTEKPEASLPEGFQAHLTDFNSKSDDISYWISWTINYDDMPYNLTVGNGEKRDSYTNTELNPEQNSLIFIRAVTPVEDSKVLYGQFSSVSVLRVVPPFSELDKPKKTPTSFKVPLQKLYGNANYARLIVVKLDSPAVPTHDPKDHKPEELVAYDDAEKTSKPLIYVAAILSREEVQKGEFVVGDDTSSSLKVNTRRRRATDKEVEYYNEPVEPGTFYSMFQRSFESEEVYYSTRWLPPIQTSSFPSDDDEDSGFPVVGVLCGVVVIIVAAVIVVVVLHKKRLIHLPIRKPKPNTREPEEQEFDDIVPTTQYDTIPPACGYVNVTVKNNKKTGQKPASKVIYPLRPSHSAVSVAEFSHYVEELKNNDLFAKEFKEFPQGQQYTWDIAKSPEFKVKNRYQNIVAYDHNRVVLDLLPDDPGSHYINASYIDGYSTPNAYIATQGPSLATIHDFWRMIWQFKIDCIVMLTNLQEVGKVKCNQYWDDKETEKHGDISVTVLNSKIFSAYTIRTIQVQKLDEDPRIVKQFHFTSWPDQSVPKIPSGLLSFTRRVRIHHPDNKIPMMVHCSAGIGRTGAFIAIDSMLEQTKEEGTVDVYNFLYMMRSKRSNMVQTQDQYKFIHTAIQEHILCGVTEINLNDTRYHLRKLSQANESGMTGLQEQHQRLNLITTPLLKEACASAYHKENEKKNRFPEIVPPDYARPRLSLIEGIDGADYINAIYLDAFQQRDAFLVTQHPLEDTVDDFWRMVFEHRCTSIVMLNRVEENPKLFSQYWPVQGANMYGSLVVEIISEQDRKGFTARKMKIYKYMDPNQLFELCQFVIKKWPRNGIPADPNDFLLMLDAVQKFQNHAGGGKIVVHCSDGSGRSGTFVTAHNVLERVKAEQVLDVFQCIRTMRNIRPSLVETAEQYKFCFDIVLTYVDSLANYSNFSDA